jgi:uncharacterized sulfatase
VHAPLQATRADYEAVGDIAPHRARVYAAMIRALDRSVGRIMAKLAAERLAGKRSNAPFRGGKGTFSKAVFACPCWRAGRRRWRRARGSRCRWIRSI